MESGNMMKLALQQLLFFLILIFLIYPFILSAANRLINRFWSPYWRTVGTIVITAIIGGIVAFVVTKVTGHRDAWLLRGVSLLIMTLVGGAIFKALVHHKDGAPLDYGRAALACLALAIISMLIGLALAPWQRGVAARMKAAMPAPAAAASAAPASAPAMAASVAHAVKAPVAAQTAARPGAAPAQTASTH